MANADYYATYCRFHAQDAKESVVLFGSDCLVGDIWTIDIPAADGRSCAQLVNRFDTVVGHLDIDMTEQVQLAQARGWAARAILASVYITDTDDSAEYWGEVVVMCFTPNTPYETFVHTVAQALADGVRPNVDLGKAGAEQVVASNGSWLPETRVPKIETPRGSALVKDALSFNEKMVEAARAGNLGCLVVGWLFIAALVVGAVLLLVRML